MITIVAKKSDFEAEPISKVVDNRNSYLTGLEVLTAYRWGSVAELSLQRPIDLILLNLVRKVSDFRLIVLDAPLISKIIVIKECQFSPIQIPLIAHAWTFFLKIEVISINKRAAM